MHIFPVSGQSAPIFLCVFDGKGQNHGSRPPFSMCRVSCGKWAFRALAPNGAQGARPRTVSARKPLPKQTAKLEFARRAGGQVVTNVVCNRSLPDPLGIVLWRYKSEFVGPSEHVIPNQCALLSWESPSNSRRPIVIQTVLFVPFSGILPREVVRLTGGLPHQSEDWFAMTGNSIARQIPICRIAALCR